MAFLSASTANLCSASDMAEGTIGCISILGTIKEAAGICEIEAEEAKEVVQNLRNIAPVKICVNTFKNAPTSHKCDRPNNRYNEPTPSNLRDARVYQLNTRI